MKLLIIRHGDPDYAHDSLTEKGWKEAELLSYKLKKMKMDHIYVSPLGRAKDTASFTLKAIGREAIELDWLQEFPPRIYRPDVKQGKTICWDWLPEDWTRQEMFFDRNEWKNAPEMLGGHVGELYEQVVQSFDALLAEHGYVREGNYYRAVKANEETIVLFCHFGLECVLLSHLLNISPMLIWHGFAAAPSSVSTLCTEERREGIAYFRASAIGDISHLYAGDEEPAFAARFCECYSNENQRHD